MIPGKCGKFIICITYANLVLLGMSLSIIMAGYSGYCDTGVETQQFPGKHLLHLHFQHRGE